MLTCCSTIYSRGLFNFAQKTIPLLLDAVSESEHSPTLLVTGATSSIRGSAKFGTLAAGMFARRALAQSLAREFHPQGVHVAHAIIDGIIDVPRTRGHTTNGGVEDSKLKPEGVSTLPLTAFPRTLLIAPADCRKLLAFAHSTSFSFYSGTRYEAIRGNFLRTPDVQLPVLRGALPRNLRDLENPTSN